MKHCSKLEGGDPHISQTKGRKKDGEKVSHNNRLKSGLEVSLNKSWLKGKHAMSVESMVTTTGLARKQI